MQLQLPCYSALLLIGTILILAPWPADANDDGCNEVVCGSVVSKCLITQSCQCKLNDCHCCKDCLNCLGELYIECCGCLDMCPKHKDALPSLTPRSEIGDIEGLPELFDTLTAEDDEGWSTIRFPMRAGFKQRVQGGGGSGAPRDAGTGAEANTVCTVIYVNSCIRANKCRQQCESMGASSYRWFHDGCCECVGGSCLNYGINESRCRGCPEEQDQLHAADTVPAEAEQDLERFFGNEEIEDGWSYGEDDDFSYADKNLD
ncbi:protein twisted gastrulation [Drosophila rhopaloa]|uniref:Protein twisted gastrulation n=1 Tax=Drosophila rhopaloa TaxID=1041015 RepID=A0ABM5GWB4_DRORH|nr:protein twisted gastrulation [Drosophila rhopaloa]